MIYFSIFFLVLSFYLSPSHGYEIDNFTRRYEPLKDSRDLLNDEVNAKLKEVQRRGIKAEVGCNTEELESLVEGELTSGPIGIVGVIETFAYGDRRIDRHRITRNNIYSKRSLKEKRQGAVMTFFGQHSTINLNGHYIGDDKLGHFFDQGFGFFLKYKEASDPQRGIADALDEGIESEKGLYGLQTTGIMSYADLAANYSGFQFWMNLHQGSQPYFKCQGGQWKQVRQFDFADYVDASWDEAINCNQYKGNLGEKVQLQAQELEAKAKKNKKSHQFQCPVSISECVRLQEKYRNRKGKLLGPGCVDAKGTSDGRSHAQISARSLGESKYDSSTGQGKPAAAKSALGKEKAGAR